MRVSSSDSQAGAVLDGGSRSRRRSSPREGEAVTANRASPELRDFVGEAPSMVRLRQLALQVAPKNVTLLINGESGTGKEVLARFIHMHSERSQRAFVAINCAALPESLVESELFGHEAGAFTGAVSARCGCFEEAHLGTLFLDEITEIQPHVQAKLLRVLQEREIRRVGGDQTRKLDVRIIAASSRNLQKAVDDGSLRDDLYYRLATVELLLPPLRERIEDILPLTLFLLQKHAARNGSRLCGVSPETLHLLHAHSWPGNVRELENAIARATVVALVEDGAVLLPHHLPPKLYGDSGVQVVETGGDTGSVPDPYPEPLTPSFREAMVALRRQYALRALRQANGNKAEAARLLGVSRRGFYNILEGS